MRLTKTSVHRLQLEKDCGCRAVKEYEDMRYTKAIGEGTVSLCEKHSGKAKDTKEMLSEMLLETLELQAEAAGKQAPLGNQRHVAEGDSAGVQASGDSVQALGVTNLPKRPTRNPLAVTKLTVDRPSITTEHLNLASVEDINNDDGITITGDIDTVPEDPKLSAILGDGLGMGDQLDAEDMRDAGITVTRD